MRVAVTGTPGTGKTTAVERLSADHLPTLEGEWSVVHLNDLVREEGLTSGVDEERDSDIVDLEALRDHVADQDDVVFESHLAHHLPVDRVAVLRCRPEELERRLTERGEAPEKARENAESEALDVILGEAVAEHGLESIYEIDTTDRDPDAVAADIGSVLTGAREPSAGTVAFEDYL